MDNKISNIHVIEDESAINFSSFNHENSDSEHEKELINKSNVTMNPSKLIDYV